MTDARKKGATTVTNLHITQLRTAAAAIENILSDLSACDILKSEAKIQTEANNKTKDIEPNIVVVKQIVPAHAISISFKDVVGNDEAKQALFENVILPLTISDVAKVKIFSGKVFKISIACHFIHNSSCVCLTKGIRAGSGNVMLYGPAGTGKTIMCQAAAFEARAELIIGQISI